MKIINGITCFDAWKSACDLLLQQGAQEHIFIEIQSPCSFNDISHWLSIRSAHKIVDNGDNIRHVIKTIFPYTLLPYVSNRGEFYSLYKKIYLRGSNHSWGTYFQRLISFDNHFKNNGENQLEDCIRALNSGSPQKHYIVFHLSARNLESNVRPMGAPCWHFGEVTVNKDDSINLFVVYRAHDYFNKAFGNYIGLSKLLEFICNETGRQPGKLLIHSIYAYNSSSNKNMASLIQ